MTIQALQSRALVDSTTLSKWYLKNMIEPAQVIGVLNANKISFVLAGLHGLSAWMREPRGTKDVAVIVATRHVKKAVRWSSTTAARKSSRWSARFGQAKSWCFEAVPGVLRPTVQGTGQGVAFNR